MKQIVVEKQCDRAALYERLTAIRSLQPVDEVAVIIITGNAEVTHVYLPDDISKEDEAEARKIVEGHQPGEPSPPPIERKWAEFAMALNESRLNKEVIIPIKHATEPVAQQGAIWDTCEQIEKATTLSIYSDEARVRGLCGHFQFLFGQFYEAEIEVLSEIRQELIDLLRLNGFPEVASLIPPLDA